MDIQNVFDKMTDEMFAISTDTYDLYELVNDGRIDCYDREAIEGYREKHDKLISQALSNVPALTHTLDELPEEEREILIQRLVLARRKAVGMYSKLRDPDCFDLAVATNICLESLRS